MANIWLINHYASTPTTGIGGRHHYFAKALAEMGHKVTLIAARSHHLLREGVDVSALAAKENVSGYTFLRLDVPRYANAHDKRRTLAWAVFAARLWTMRVKPEDQPDVVLYSSPHLPGFLGAQRLARRYGARLVFEVRDIWPLTLVEIGGFSPRHPVIRFFQWIEDHAYAHADRVVSNLPGAVDHMVQRGMDRTKFAWVSNGISIEENTKPEPLSAELIGELPTGHLRVVYTGTLGSANCLDFLLEAAALVRDLPISFILVGQGTSLMALQAHCDRLKLNNVRFLGPIPKNQVQSILSISDVAYIGWKNTNLYAHGISANKIYDYFYAGKPILHSYSGNHDPVAKYHAGITVKAENPIEIADALRKLYTMSPSERAAMGQQGRFCAENDFDYAILARRLEDVLTR